MNTSFEKFKALSINKLVKLISRETHKPELIVYLLNNLNFQGTILSISEKDMDGLYICFQSSKSNSLTYFKASHILAIEILNPNKLAVQLSEGEIPRQPNEKEKISQLQLKRWIKNQISTLDSTNKDFTISLPVEELSDTDRMNLKDVIALLMQVIKKHTSDEMGKEAWCQIEAIHLQHSTQKIEIIREGSILNVSMEYKKALHKEFALELENALLEKL
jgi:hypothetical protein